MGNEIKTTERNVFERYGDAATQGTITGKLLRFNKFGEYIAGQDQEKIPYGTELIVAMPSLMIGWMRWDADGRPESHMGLVAEGYVPLPRAELGHTDRSEWQTDDEGRPRDPWQQANTVIMADHKDLDRLFTFSATSKGGLNAMGILSKDHGRHIKLKPNDLPVIRLEGDSYRHPNKKYGEIRFPVFEIVRWVSGDMLPQIAGVTVERDEVPF